VTRHIRTVGTWEAVLIAVLAQGALTVNSLYTWYIYQLVGLWSFLGGDSWMVVILGGRKPLNNYNRQPQPQNKTGLPALQRVAPRLDDRVDPGLHLGVRLLNFTLRVLVFV
jgi:hypothetical protein